MGKLNLEDVKLYVEENIGTFHRKRIDSLDRLKLSKILKRKNPYLFKAKHILTAEELIRGILDAHISSNEETIFGDWLEGLAIFINEKVYNGKKSGIKGIDLEFDKDGKRYIVSIKSGPNWGNSSQIRRLVSDFTAAIRTLRTSNSGLNVIPVNGCCYGKDSKPYKKKNYYKYCGQDFWHFISGEKNLYTDIIEPLGEKAKERNEEFQEIYGARINKFVIEFGKKFCEESGKIDWKKLVEYNSSSTSDYE